MEVSSSVCWKVVVYHTFHCSLHLSISPLLPSWCHDVVVDELELDGHFEGTTGIWCAGSSEWSSMNRCGKLCACMQLLLIFNNVGCFIGLTELGHKRNALTQFLHHVLEHGTQAVMQCCPPKVLAATQEIVSNSCILMTTARYRILEIFAVTNFSPVA